jgi:hypothetical protein
MREAAEAHCGSPSQSRRFRVRSRSSGHGTVWYCMVLLYGTTVWYYCMVLLYGTMVLLYGTVWYCSPSRRRCRVRSRSSGLMAKSSCRSRPAVISLEERGPCPFHFPLLCLPPFSWRSVTTRTGLHSRATIPPPPLPLQRDQRSAMHTANQWTAQCVRVVSVRGNSGWSHTRAATLLNIGAFMPHACGLNGAGRCC